MFLARNISQKYSNACELYLFRSFKGITEENLGTYSEMSAMSLSIPQPPGSIAVTAPGDFAHYLSSGELAGYRVSTSRRNAVQTSFFPANLNGRSKIWKSQDLKIYDNSEYFFATFPIALALFWGTGGREIASSEPLSRVFGILSRFLDKTGVNNYLSGPQVDGFSRYHGDMVCPFGAFG